MAYVNVLHEMLLHWSSRIMAGRTCKGQEQGMFTAGVRGRSSDNINEQLCWLTWNDTGTAWRSQRIMVF